MNRFPVTRLFVPIIPLLILATFAPSSLAAETSCAELNRLYLTKYIDDFSIDTKTFEINRSRKRVFKCNGQDKNFVLARAINDLDRLRPYKEAQTDFYNMLKMVFQMPGVSIRYDKNLGSVGSGDARIEATAFSEPDGSRSTLVLSELLMTRGKRFRATYLLVHEVRHLIYKKKLPDGRVIPDEPRHVVCTRGKHAGKKLRVCDEVLTFDNRMAFGSGNSYEFSYLVFVRDHPLASMAIKTEARQHLRYLASHMFNRLEPGILGHYRVTR